MKSLILALLLCGMVGCTNPDAHVDSQSEQAKLSATSPFHPEAVPANCDADTMFFVAMNKLPRNIDRRLTGRTEKTAITPARIERQRARLACLSHWADGLTDSCYQLGWRRLIKVYSSDTDDAEMKLLGKQVPEEENSFDKSERLASEFERTHKQLPNPDEKCYDKSEMPK